MRARTRSLLGVLGIIGVLGALACIGAVFWLVVAIRAAPGSLPYEPASPREEAEMMHARRDLHPDEVRADLAGHRVEVAWAGLLEDAVFRGAPEHDVTMTIEHHYFDWIDDHSARREHFLLSPRGEGRVRFSWPLDPTWDLDAMRRLAPQGTMIVVYGTPVNVDGDVIDLGRAAYVRSIPADVVSTTVLDYGR